ncbi:MAG: DUF2339 domain-containing protein, partial [candidate division Zixibacteria bacterium]|nr:DUF2339 domain-containing protein [candidate division Zixibacteria bacterium]
MNEQIWKALEQRLRELEGSVAEIRRGLDYLLDRKAATPPDLAQQVNAAPEPLAQSAPQPTAQAPTTPVVSPVTPSQPPQPYPAQQAYGRQQKPASEVFQKFLSSEFLINKLGIGLLLFGVVFLFKYSIDQGWITPLIRVVCGSALGGILLGFGLKLYSKKQHYSLVLLGGAMATFYITIFAAFQMYQLISHPTAFAAMCAVTILALALALNKNDMILSLIGTIGGLGTPFFLYTGEGSIPGLVTYTCSLLFGTLGIYFFKGWRPLMAVSVIGGWMVMLVAINAVSLGDNASVSNQWAVQAGLMFAFLAFWLTPVSREIVNALKSGTDSLTTKYPLAHMSAISAPIMGLGLSITLWEITGSVTEENWGIVAFSICAMYGLAGWRLYRWPRTAKLAYTHSMIAGFFFTLALALILEGDALLITLATEAALLSFISQKLNDRGVRIAGNILAGIVLLWLAARIFFDHTNIGLTSADSLSDLWVIAMGVLIAYVYRHRFECAVYLIDSVAALAFWLARGLEGNLEFIALLLLGSALYFTSEIHKHRQIRAAAHVFFAALGVYFITRLEPFGADGLSLFNVTALADALFIAAIVVIAMRSPEKTVALVYALAAHLAGLGLVFREFVELENGQGYVSAIWGTYSIALLVAGFRAKNNMLRKVGMATLLLVIAKLFVVDLANLE